MSKNTKATFFTLPKLIILGLALIATYFCMWLFMRSAIVKGVSNTLQNMEGEGFLINHDGLTVSGFPLKLLAQSDNVSVRAPIGIVTDPSKNWALTFQNILVKSTPYAPLTWHLDHSGSARIDMRAPTGERYMFDIEPAHLRTKTGFTLGGRIKSAQANIDKMRIHTLVGSPPPLLALDQASAKIITNGSLANISINASNIALTDALIAPIRQTVEQTVEHIQVQGKITHWDILESQGAELWQNNGGRFIVEKWALKWGKINFTGDLDLQFKDNFPDGIIHVRVKDTEPLLISLQEANLLNDMVAARARVLLNALDTDENGRKEFEIVVRDRQVKLGFIPLFSF